MAVSAGLLRQVLPSGSGRHVVAGVEPAGQRRPAHPVRRARDQRGRELLPQPRHHSQAKTTAARVSVSGLLCQNKKRIVLFAWLLIDDLGLG